MVLGASALGQAALGGLGSAAVGEVSYVNCAAEITATFNIQCGVSIAGTVDCAAAITISSNIQSALSIVNVHYVDCAAQINMAFTLQAAVGIASPLDILPPVNLADLIQVEATLEAWNFLSANGLTDTIVANADTVEEIEAVTSTLNVYGGYERVLHRTQIMLKQAEDAGILTDVQIADASTVADVRVYLETLLGINDGHGYSAYYQGC